jgi:Domain of unknown function (DUF4326)
VNLYVVHCRYGLYDVYIGRPSKWGNPFEIGKDGTRYEVIEKYREYIKTAFTEEEIIKELKGKVLGCWCAPEECHGDVLAEIANREKQS